MLDPAQFAEAAGDPQNFEIKVSKWTLADGKLVSGTEYAKLKKDQAAHVPDLHGIFLRGKNDKHRDTKETELGDYTPDQVGKHGHDIVDPGHLHPISVPGNGKTGSGNGARFVYAVDNQIIEATETLVARAKTGVTVNEWPGPETAPKSVTVNYFIRIN